MLPLVLINIAIIIHQLLLHIHPETLSYVQQEELLIFLLPFIILLFNN